MALGLLECAMVRWLSAGVYSKFEMVLCVARGCAGSFEYKNEHA